MNKADWIILRLLREAKIKERYSQEDYIKATMYLREKYGVEKVLKNLEILDREKFDEINYLLKKSADKVIKQYKNSNKLRGKK